MIKIVNNSFYLYLRCSEINEQTQLEPGCLEIMDTLRSVNIFYIFNGFQFHNNTFFYKQICNILPYRDLIIIDWYGLLLLYFKTLLSKFMGKGILINFLKKAIP